MSRANNNHARLIDATDQVDIGAKFATITEAMSDLASQNGFAVFIAGN